MEKRLISSESDETLSQVRYFLHGTASMIDAREIEKAGLHCRESRHRALYLSAPQPSHLASFLL